jgi:uncharacterized alpha-E superfamily protein
MLSRIAESLFWVGRYIERAEQTARILDVQFHRLLEDPWVDEGAACAALLRVMGVKVPGGGAAAKPPTAAPDGDDDSATPGGDDEKGGEGAAGIGLSALEICDVLAYDRANPSSIVSSLTAARNNASGAREAISSDMWECLNGTWYRLDSEVAQARTLGPYGFFRFVKERVAVVNGLAGGTLSRDDGWRFLVLGESLERVDMTARLLSALWQDPEGAPGWVTTLRCCSAHEAYLRTYRDNVSANLVTEFLLLDRLFPRSVFHALSTAELCLAELDPASSRFGVEDEARRIVGKARTDLEFRRTDELLDDMTPYLSRLQAACSQAATAVAARYFRSAGPIEWSA